MLKNKNRLIALTAIVSTACFGSFFGGSFAYAMFFFALAIPAVSVIYALYVYFRLRIYQSVNTKIITKGEKIKYKYILSNEDRIYYKNISVGFSDEYSKVEKNVEISGISLYPAERFSCETSITCLYRGEYKIGINTLYISDLFGLLRLTRNNGSMIYVRVYPRVLPLVSLSALEFSEIKKDGLYKPFSKKEVYINDLKDYEQSDSKRAINWKASAHEGKLLVRKLSDNPESDITFFMDSAVIEKDNVNPVIVEDKILEITLSILNYYMNRNEINTEIFYVYKEFKRIKIKDKESFDEFYETTSDIKFDRDITIDRLVRNALGSFATGDRIIIITANVNANLLGVIEKINSLGKEICIIYIDCGQINSELLDHSKAKFIGIKCNDDITRVLG